MMSTMIHTLRLCNTHLIVDQTPLLEESVHPHDAPTSPAKFLLQAVTVRYSAGLRRYVLIMKSL
jgi:hypothetical protein